MDEYIETVRINERQRIVVEPDYYANNPLQDWDFEAGMYPLDVDRYFDRDKLTLDYKDTVWGLDRLRERLSGEDFLHAANKHLNRKGLVALFCTFYGQSRGDTIQAILFSEDADYAVGLRDVFAQYWRGDVYVVSLQRQNLYVNVDDATDTHTRWETLESIHECFLDDLLPSTLAGVLGVSIEVGTGEYVGGK